MLGTAEFKQLEVVEVVEVDDHFAPFTSSNLWARLHHSNRAMMQATSDCTRSPFGLASESLKHRTYTSGRLHHLGLLHQECHNTSLCRYV